MCVSFAHKMERPGSVVALPEPDLIARKDHAMAKRELPSQEVLRQLLTYDPETGRLFWRERGPKWFRATPGRSPAHAMANWNSRYAGKEAFTWSISGYAFGTVKSSATDDKEKFAAHRVIWKIVHGVDPDEIDHINGDRKDNRIINLRAVSRAENAKNVGLGRANKSGHIGVFWNNRAQAWSARIKINQEVRHIGNFRDVAEAGAARKAAEVALGFHSNHGRPLAKKKED